MIDLNKGMTLKQISENDLDMFDESKDFLPAYIEECAAKIGEVFEKKIKDGIDKGWFAYVYNDNGEVRALEITKKGNRHFKREARHFLWAERWQRLKGYFKRQK